MAGITKLHNDGRAAVDPPAASPIPPLVWSAEVAGVAQAHADKCVFEHSGGDYGENLYASTGDSKPADVVSSWVSEVADYDYASNGCSGVCGHYTQVVCEQPAARLRGGEVQRELAVRRSCVGDLGLQLRSARELGRREAILIGRRPQRRREDADHQLGLLRYPAVTDGRLQGPAGAVTATSRDEKR
ncbi:CAP domain-containing protein [Nannocystis sp.]|uniref:CAP domain-containing protein n=1 Tax=Nannocystis sp. TaxID=1962667 RepID=UPI0025F582A4|nr:CAP domain-containing protein [Nannocystis sp.]